MGKVKIKLCGLSRVCDIEEANALAVEYVGFIFVPESRRYVAEKTAYELKSHLSSEISSVGVFMDETPERIASLMTSGVIDAAQLHGGEDEEYIKKLKALTDKPIIKAFSISCEKDVERASQSGADYVLLDSAVGGSGRMFDWDLVRSLQKPYFLAGGLSPENVREAVSKLAPYALDVSSGIETNGLKDPEKMRKFVFAVRGKEENNDK